MPLLLVTMAVSKNSFTAFIMYSVSMNTVDIGLAQLAMHSPYETEELLEKLQKAEEKHKRRKK